MAKTKAEILLVEDEDIQRNELTTLLESENYSVTAVANVSDAKKAINNSLIEIVLSDFSLPDGTGQDVLLEVVKVNPNIQVIFITAYGSVDGAVEAMKHGAVDYLTKPVDIDKLFGILKNSVKKRTALEDINRLKDESDEPSQYENIIAKSESMKSVLSLAGRVAQKDTTVLIRGESGTGKEVIARLIHNASERSNENFVAFNAAALSPSLIESELFGHVKGSFTGATSDRKGRFVEADHGTIFIDEVGDLPISSQPKFLRVLQESCVEPVGATNTIKVDIRVIAATNRNLEDMIEKETFRSDLFYRLNVVDIFIPPLRERKEDIMPLCDYFLDKFNKKNSSTIEGFEREAEDKLMRYKYPGNVRELENIIERAVILCRDNLITTDDLPSEVTHSTSDSDEHYSGEGLDERVSSMEAKLIKSALDEAGGNQSKAARALNISERKLRYKMKKLDL